MIFTLMPTDRVMRLTTKASACVALDRKGRRPLAIERLSR